MIGEHIERCATHVRRHGDAGGDAALEARDAHHEELVEVAREDREEVGALEQRQRVVLGELEHALVEREPRQLAVEESVARQLRIVDEDGVAVVVVEQVGRDRRVAQRAAVVHHGPIMPARA
jgi:hypothetical protein